MKDLDDFSNETDLKNFRRIISPNSSESRNQKLSELEENYK